MIYAKLAAALALDEAQIRIENAPGKEFDRERFLREAFGNDPPAQ